MSADPVEQGWPTAESYFDPAWLAKDAPKGDRTSSPPLQALLRKLRHSRLFANGFLYLFRTLQGWGVSVLPNHYYSPIPDIRTLENRPWTARTPAFAMGMASQIQFVTDVVERFATELDFPSHPLANGYGYHRNNGYFEAVDAEIAYCMVRHFKPTRMVEVGGGFSTRILAHAVCMNRREGHDCSFFSVEPYPDQCLRRGMPGLTQLITRRVQDTPMALFATLGPGDILFIDSSHVAGIGSDVVYQFLEVLPRLQPGVLVHIHDIFYPADYPRDAVLKLLWFWSEQYLLEALLTGNSGYEILWGSSAMQMYYPDLLQQAFPAWHDSYAAMPRHVQRCIPSADGKHVWPSSFWMRKTRADLVLEQRMESGG
jgi:hypothetical protein